ncbi:hypothetical protein [Thioalkalivibrio sp. ALJ1]|uniref:hypothetical protein n=1 Tax=Thioalkalivibrio sp. ALJ1 TaxID=1158144 RepID=UPI000570FEA3|nr:hypothetical protein [Thioalkalivibrio sp. ALJ1]
MEDSKTHYYVEVNEPEGGEYYVGPFGEAGDSFSHGRAAIDWVYRQVGLLKVANPDAELVKHRWHYQESEHGFDDPTVEIAVEIAGYRMEIKSLRPPAFCNVIEEPVQRKSAVESL